MGPAGTCASFRTGFPPSVPMSAAQFCAVEGMVFLTTPGLGRSEIVIETADHLAAPTQLADEQFAAVFRAYRDRIVSLADDGRLAYASVFKNVGAEAGASLGHTHSQIVATPVVPELVEAELAGGRDYLARTRRCVFCDLIGRELASGVRVVVRSEHFLVVTAFAPRFAYELWVLPTAHTSRFESITDEHALELARLMKRALTALDRRASRAGIQLVPAHRSVTLPGTGRTITGTSRSCREPLAPPDSNGATAASSRRSRPKPRRLNFAP